MSVEIDEVEKQLAALGVMGDPFDELRPIYDEIVRRWKSNIKRLSALDVASQFKWGRTKMIVRLNALRKMGKLIFSYKYGWVPVVKATKGKGGNHGGKGGKV